MVEDSKETKDKEEIWFSAFAGDQTQEYDTDEAFDRFRKKTKIGRRRVPQWVYVTVSAAVILLAVVPGLYFIHGKFTKSTPDITVESPSCSLCKVKMPDGTIVWLNTDSKLTYSQDFGKKNRDVSLEGEGYFEVVKNPKLPFRVSTKEFIVAVLGTKFNLKNYIGDKEASVSLLEGRVAVNDLKNESEERYLSPSEKMVMDKETGNVEIRQMDNDISSKDWINKQIFFDESRLDDIAKQLSRTFGVDIVVSDSALCSRRLYGSFDLKEQSLNEILDVLSMTGQFEFERTGNNITIRK